MLEQELAVQQDALAAARKAEQVTLNQYQAGIVSILNVVTAQATVLAAQTTLLNLQNRGLVAAATLLKNIPGRWDTNLPTGQPTRSASPG